MAAVCLAFARPARIDDSGRRAVVSGTEIEVSQLASEVEHRGMTPSPEPFSQCRARLVHAGGILAVFPERQAMRRSFGALAATVTERLELDPPRRS